MTYLQRIAMLGKLLHGMKEKGNNRGPLPDMIFSDLGRPVESTQWCALDASWLAHQAARSMNKTSNIKSSSSAVRLFHRNKALACTLEELEPGCIVCRVRDVKDVAAAKAGEFKEGHAYTLVEHFSGPNWVTAQGNTSSKSEDDNGEGHFVKLDDVSDPRIVGFLKPTAA